jgi:hypothetical protein
VLDGCWKAGANGFLWWCFRDIVAEADPYPRNTWECALGLVDASGKIKPGHEALVEFARQRPAATEIGYADTAIFWPEEYYDRERPRNPGNEPRSLSSWMGLAWHALAAAGVRPGIVTLAGLAGSRVRTLLLPGVVPTGGEIAALARWVEEGGRLIWTGVPVTQWGPETARITGAVPEDLDQPLASGVKAFGTVRNFDSFALDTFVRVRAGRARVAARTTDGAPVVLVNELGGGRVVTCIPRIEAAFIADLRKSPSAIRPVVRWYRGLLSLAERGRKRNRTISR